jgi:hypothetical protein
MTTVLPFLKDRPGCLSFSYADLLAFLFSLDKSIGSGCFVPGLDPSVDLIGGAAITEMIKLQFKITDRIRNKIKRNGNWFPKFKVCHGDYLVNHLPHCVCDNCSQFRHERGIQMWNDCYPNTYFGPIFNSPSEMQLIVGPVVARGQNFRGSGK